MVVMVLALVVLVGLVAFVLNMGDQVNSRVDTQHSADAAGQGGGVWIARTMNTVAMNNVAQSRYIALVNVMDGMPLATESAHHEQTFFRDALSQRMSESFDTDREERAREQLFQMRLDKADNDATVRAIKAVDTRQRLAPAAAILGTDEDATLRTLHEYQQRMTPEEMAVARLYSEGRLDEFVEKRRKEQEEAARRAQHATGMNARASGARAFQDPEENPHPTAMQWYSLSNSARKKHVEQHGWPPYDPDGMNSR